MYINKVEVLFTACFSFVYRQQHTEADPPLNSAAHAVPGLTLKATGSVLLQRQWEGRTEHRKFGLSVRTSSAGWSAMISAMLRFSWGRSLGTGAVASGCPAGEFTSFIFPGTGWRLLDGGLNLRLALGSTGIRITTAWIIRKDTKGSPAPLSFFPTLAHSGRTRECAPLLAEPQRACQWKMGLDERTPPNPNPLQTFSGRLQTT